MSEAFEGTQEKPSMNEKETIAFLEENGIAPVGDDWQPGQSLLYVLDEGVRRRFDEYGQGFPVDKVASIARLDNPTSLKWTIKDSKVSGHTIGTITNAGGQVDYYAIHPGTKRPVLVGTSHPMKVKPPFYVQKSNVFTAADMLFPKSN